MSKLVLVLGLVVTVLVAESTCQHIIYPTYRPPPQPRQPIIRTAREASKDPQPSVLPMIDDIKLDPNTRHARSLTKDDIIDDIKLDPNTRHARSLSTPGHGRIGTNDRKSGSSHRGHDTDASHPGPANNRRNARSAGLPEYATTPPFNPKPWPGFPKRGTQ